MLKQNPGLEYGPIKCMIDEHKQFRELIAIALKSYESFVVTKSEKDKICCYENLNKFIDQLLVHIEKEDNILYKIADSLDYEVSSGDDEMLSLFKKIQMDYQDKIKKFL